MSQVIVTSDNLNSKREKSKDQERHIDKDVQFNKWRRNDITGPDIVAKLIGFAVMPILALWGILGGIMALMITVVNYIFKGLGRIVGGSKDLIRGD